jgi:8-oxo-dGTP pyrophosphatase MutT (NUDIX family)
MLSPAGRQQPDAVEFSGPLDNKAAASGTGQLFAEQLLSTPAGLPSRWVLFSLRRTQTLAPLIGDERLTPAWTPELFPDPPALLRQLVRCLDAEARDEAEVRRQVRRFASELSYGRHQGPAPSDARPAAVAVLLYPRQGCWHVPFTLRPQHLPDHAGQVSLPGGAREPGESDLDCALRELEEEIAVRPDQVQVAGRLTPTYVYRSHFLVQPFVLVAERQPQFRPNPQEVAELIEIPLSQLLDPGRASRFAVSRQPLSFTAPCLDVGCHRIWGATALILGEFLAVTRSSGCRFEPPSQ